VHSIGCAEQGDVDVVVDYEEGAGTGCNFADAAREHKELTAGKTLVAELNDVGSPARGSGSQVDDVLGRRVGSDDVQVSGEEPL
jgi:predicted nucleotidyltransferase